MPAAVVGVGIGGSEASPGLILLSMIRTKVKEFLHAGKLSEDLVLLEILLHLLFFYSSKLNPKK